jgi:hypothetical protein
MRKSREEKKGERLFVALTQREKRNFFEFCQAYNIIVSEFIRSCVAQLEKEGFGTDEVQTSGEKEIGEFSNSIRPHKNIRTFAQAALNLCRAQIGG